MLKGKDLKWFTGYFYSFYTIFGIHVDFGGHRIEKNICITKQKKSEKWILRTQWDTSTNTVSCLREESGY